MSIKNKILTGLAAIIFSLASQSNLQAIPATPNELPKGWEIRQPKKEIRVKVGDKVYLETLITTEKLILYPKKNVPLLWTTTDLEGKPILDINECRKADVAATIAYLNENGNLAEAVENLGKSLEKASKLTFGYDVLEKTLQGLLKLEGKILQRQLMGSTKIFTEIVESEIKKLITEKTKNIVEYKGVVNLSEKVKELIEESVYARLNASGKALVESAEELKKQEGTLAYEKVSHIYTKLKKAWIDGLSTMEFWSKLKEYTGKEVAIIIINQLTEGLTNYSLDDLIRIAIDKDKKLTEALEAEHKKKSEIEEMLKENIENMFRYGKGTAVQAFFNPDLMDKFDLSDPEKTLELLVDGMNNKNLKYSEITSLLTGYQLKEFKNRCTEETYKKTGDKKEVITDFKIIKNYKLSDHLNLILSKGKSPVFENEETYLFSILIQEEDSWKIALTDGHPVWYVEDCTKPIKSFKQKLECFARLDTYKKLINKGFYEGNIYDVWSKGKIKENLSKCKKIYDDEISSGSYNEEEIKQLEQGKERIEWFIQKLETTDPSPSKK